MRIRRYLIFVVVNIFIILILSLLIYRQVLQKKIDNQSIYQIKYGISSFTKVEKKSIKLYTANGHKDFSIRGVRLSSYYPKYEINKSEINKTRVIKWLEEIKDLNANTILVPYIQPIGFYSAIYEYNLTHEEPIYLIHEISLNDKLVKKTYNAFDKKLYKEITDEIKKTIDAVHGLSISISDKRHKGIYLKDISKFNLGYIIGNNTFPELVTITNKKNSEIKTYQGKYYSIDDGNAFEVFITKLLDYTRDYEINKYKHSSILSYLTTIETDPFNYQNEPNLTKRANIDLNKIIDRTNGSLFVSFVAQPNDPDFIDFESMFSETEENFYSTYLNKINQHYKYPVIITEVGVSSSRGKSKINLSNGYDRGNFNEIEQGKLLVQLLEFIKEANIKGVFIDSFQDNWGRVSSFNLKRYINENVSNYWYDAQASDEAFGLLAFESSNPKRFAIIDGNVDDWKDTKEIINDQNMSLKAKADTSYLYLLVKKKYWSYLDDDIYIGIDTINGIGSNYYKDDDVKLNVNAEYIVELTGINTSRVVVNDRYNIFNYLYKYNENILGKQEEIPSKKSSNFSGIDLLNRKQFVIRKNKTVENAVYYETGKLVHGSLDPKSEDYNSLADFNKNDDYVELRIPWTILNFTDPLNKKALSDFYIYGTKKETRIGNINFSITLKNKDKEKITKTGTFKLPNLKHEKYEERLKSSYYILKDYWEKGEK